MQAMIQDLKHNKHTLYLSQAVTFGWGFAAHGYMFADNSLSHDSLREFHAQILGNNIKMGSGRVFTPFYRDILGSDVTLPWLAGILALLWIGLAVYLTARIFRIESKTIIFLMAGIFTTNIAVSATTATYIHDLDSYMFSMLCAVAAVYLWKAWKYGWVLGAMIAAGAIGIYQGYLFVAVTLVMFDCILRLYREESFRAVFQDGLKAVGMILLGGIFYYVSMKAMLALTGTQLVKGDYNSMDLILHQSPAAVLGLIGGAYGDWFRRLWEAYSSYPGILVKGATAVFFLICGGALLTFLWNNGIGLQKKLLCLVLVGLLPLGMNLIYVLTISRTHDLMTFPIWLFYLFVLLNADFLAKKWPKPGRWIGVACVGLSLLLLYGNVRFSNGMYMKKDLEYDAYLSLMTRVVTRMEMTEGYVPGETTVVFVGNPENRNGMIPGFKDYWNVIGMTSSDLILEPERSRYQAYFDYILSLPIHLAEPEIWREVSHSEASRWMPCYPADGCMEFRDGMLVVKLGDVKNTEMDFYEIPD